MGVSLWLFERSMEGKIIKSTCDSVNFARRAGIVADLEVFEKVAIMRYGEQSEKTLQIMGSIYHFFEAPDDEDSEDDVDPFGIIDLCLYFLSEETGGRSFGDSSLIWKITESMKNQGFTNHEIFGRKLLPEDFSEDFKNRYVYRQTISLRPVRWR